MFTNAVGSLFGCNFHWQFGTTKVSGSRLLTGECFVAKIWLNPTLSHVHARFTSCSPSNTSSRACAAHDKKDRFKFMSDCWPLFSSNEKVCLMKRLKYHPTVAMPSSSAASRIKSVVALFPFYAMTSVSLNGKRLHAHSTAIPSCDTRLLELLEKKSGRIHHFHTML